MAAASGSSMRYASLAPALRAASLTARFSTLVTPDGTLIMTSGLKILTLATLLIT